MKMEPKSLEELASTAMAAHIANVCVSILEFIKVHKPSHPSALKELINSISEGFKLTVTSRIPPNMADKLTNLWFAYLDWSLKTSKLKITKEREMVLLHIIRAIVHPRVTYLDRYSKFHTLLLRNLDVMERLEQLEVLCLNNTTEHYLVENLSNLKHLVYLCVHFSCTNEMMHLIGDSCPNIVDLDIFGSSAVGDKSVPAILKLSRLTALNLFGTNISVDCLHKLIEAVKGLRKFGCSSFQTRTLEMLLHHKHSLNFLQVAADLHDLFALTSFNHLKAIIFHCVTFSLLKGLLPAIGGNLDHLELHDVVRVELPFVGKCCPQLARFEMHSCSYSPWTHLQLSETVPIFTCLNVLKIHLMSKYPMMSHMDNIVLLIILSKAQNIKRLSIATYSNVDREFIELLLTVNPLRRLEQFNLGSTSETLIDPETLLNLLQNCEHLNQVTVNGIEAVHFKPTLQPN